MMDVHKRVWKSMSAHERQSPSFVGVDELFNTPTNQQRVFERGTCFGGVGDFQFFGC